MPRTVQTSSSPARKGKGPLKQRLGAGQPRRDRGIGQSVRPDHVVGQKGRKALNALQALAAPEWQAINRGWLGDWLRHRLREYVNVHGYASAGVCALLEKAAAAYADADYLRAIGYKLEDYQLVLKAGSSSDRAKSHELAAYEIACREGRAKRESDALREAAGNKLGNLLAESPEEKRQLKRALRQEADGWKGGVTASTLEPLAASLAASEDQGGPEAHPEADPPPFGHQGATQSGGYVDTHGSPGTRWGGVGETPLPLSSPPAGVEGQGPHSRPTDSQENGDPE